MALFAYLDLVNLDLGGIFFFFFFFFLACWTGIDPHLLRFYGLSSTVCYACFFDGSSFVRYAMTRFEMILHQIVFTCPLLLIFPRAQPYSNRTQHLPCHIHVCQKSINPTAISVRDTKNTKSSPPRMTTLPAQQNIKETDGTASPRQSQWLGI